MVPRVNVSGEEGGGFRVGTADDEVGGAHDVALETHGDEAVDMFGDGDEDLGEGESERQPANETSGRRVREGKERTEEMTHLASHMTTFLRTRRLILDMDSRCSTLDHHLCQSHHCRQTYRGERWGTTSVSSLLAER